jgi:phosphoribosylanthranilate isomerase
MGVDYAGLIFYPKSKRYAHEKLKDQKAEIKNLRNKKSGRVCKCRHGLFKKLYYGVWPICRAASWR